MASSNFPAFTSVTVHDRPSPAEDEEIDAVGDALTRDELAQKVPPHVAQVTQKGVSSLHGMADKPWGMREFGVQTPDGHRIMIGQKIDSPGNAL